VTRASHVEIFVEEPSAAAALRELVPMIRTDLTFNIYEFQGCPDLLAKLPDRLRGYRTWLPADWRIIVLIDRDRSDCLTLKQRLLDMAEQAGLRYQKRRHAPPQVLIRIAVEELESWFFGDVPALCAAFPGVSPDLAQRAGFRDPDAIRNTWERLEQILQQAGHFHGGLQKIRCAREVALHMDPANNRSHSFRVFRDGLRAL